MRCPIIYMVDHFCVWGTQSCSAWTYSEKMFYFSSFNISTDSFSRLISVFPLSSLLQPVSSLIVSSPSLPRSSVISIMPFVDLQSRLGIHLDRWLLVQSGEQPNKRAARCHAFEKEWIECAHGIGQTRAKKECQVEFEDFYECMHRQKTVSVWVWILLWLLGAVSSFLKYLSIGVLTGSQFKKQDAYIAWSVLSC